MFAMSLDTPLPELENFLPFSFSLSTPVSLSAGTNTLVFLGWLNPDTRSHLWVSVCALPPPANNS